MSRGLDHMVIVARDLERASARFEALGFCLTPLARHPWGTVNRLIQFADHSFIELLGIADDADIRPHDHDESPPRFSFAAASEQFVHDGDGMAMLVLAGNDSRADTAAFADAGLETYAPFDFERDAPLPDGSVAKVAFSLAFATTPLLPALTFFTCHNRFPENFWKLKYQQHANGTTGIAQVLMCADQPREAAQFVAAFAASEAREDAAAYCVDCAGQQVAVMPRASLGEYYPTLLDAAQVRPGGYFAALRFRGGEGNQDAEAAGIALQWS